MAFIKQGKSDSIVQVRFDRRYLATGLKFLQDNNYPVRFMSDVIKVIFNQAIESLVKEGDVEFIISTEDAVNYIDNRLGVNLNPGGRGIMNLAKNMKSEEENLLKNTQEEKEFFKSEVEKGLAKLKEGYVPDEGKIADNSPVVTEKYLKEIREKSESKVFKEGEFDQEEFEEYEKAQNTKIPLTPD